MSKKQRLHFYTIDIKYIRDLHQRDDKVRSVSPQMKKNNRPLVGIITMVNERAYCIPLSSPKPKHQAMKNSVDLLKIEREDGKLIGVLNLNSMIPVDKTVIKEININVKKTDSPETKAYKELLNNQLDWCNENVDRIERYAQKLYLLVTSPQKSTSSMLLKRCCDFKKLEVVLDKYIQKAAQIEPQQSNPQTSRKPQSQGTFSISVKQIKRNAQNTHEQAEKKGERTKTNNKNNGNHNL